MYVTVEDIKAVDSFFYEKEIPYVLTGTSALSIHGLLPENYRVLDIDIIVVVSEAKKSYILNELKTIQKLTGCHFNSDYENELKTIQKLTGCHFNSDYENECYNFIAGPNRVKVNAIIHYAEDTKTSGIEYATVAIDGKFIRLHSVNQALKAKFRLHRPKDYMFCNSLIETILGHFKR